MDPVKLVNERLKDLLPGLLGTEFIEIGPERVRARMLVRGELCTVGGILHGGAIMAFADTLVTARGAAVRQFPPHLRE